MSSKKKALSSEVELQPYMKVAASPRSLPQTSLLCALRGSDVSVCSCVRTGNGLGRKVESQGEERSRGKGEESTEGSRELPL